MVTRCDGHECAEIRPPGAKNWLTLNDGSNDEQDGEYDLCPMHKEMFIDLVRYREPAAKTRKVG